MANGSRLVARGSGIEIRQKIALANEGRFRHMPSPRRSGSGRRTAAKYGRGTQGGRQPLSNGRLSASSSEPTPSARARRLRAAPVSVHPRLGARHPGRGLVQRGGSLIERSVTSNSSTERRPSTTKRRGCSLRRLCSQAPRGRRPWKTRLQPFGAGASLAVQAHCAARSGAMRVAHRIRKLARLRGVGLLAQQARLEQRL